MKTLFDIEDLEWWREHWKDMPEFIQEDQSSKRSIVVHFRNDEDVQKFAKLIDQRITLKQQSLWYPYLKPKSHSDKQYINDES